MEGRLLLKDCAVPDGDRIATGRAVVVEGARIVRVAADADEPVRPGDWAVAGRGRLLLPGRVDAFVRVEGAVREEASAARLGAALRAGVTTVVELVSSDEPAKALAREARAAARVGMRLVAAAAPRTPHALATHAANVAFTRARVDDPLVRGALALPDPVDWSDALLEAVAGNREALDAALLVALETDATAADAEAAPMRALERLEAHGLLGRFVVLAPALLGPDAAPRAARGGLVAWSPLAELAAARGLRGKFSPPGPRIALASGSGRDLAAQWTAARVLVPDVAWAAALLHAPAPGFLAHVFGVPGGAVREGVLADVVLLDAVPRPDAPLAEIVEAAALAPVAWTVVGGRVVVREGRLLGEDLLALEAAVATGP